MKEQLRIENLHASIEGKEILKGIALKINAGEIHAIMGPNGSGKSTLAQSLMGNPSYLGQDKSKITIGKTDLTTLKTEQRARSGLFLAFQNPISVPGVSVANLLRFAYQAKQAKVGEKKNQPKQKNPSSVWEFNKRLIEQAEILSIPKEFLGRGINDGFSGGEKKKMEMLQALVLEPKFAIFDEIDTGLDIDALKIVATGISQLKEKGCGVLIITHYQRILSYVVPDFIHILVNGKIVKSGGYNLANILEKDGYAAFTPNK